MITSKKYQTIPSIQRPNNWHFLPILSNAVIGVSVGLIIGNYLGLV
jgi:hypothetical protein